jgi:tetratricopeptide (TPR) repeat protein
MNGRRLAKWIFVLGTCAIAGCGGQNGETDAVSRDAAAGEAYVKVAKQRKVMDTPAERVEITKQFLEQYPTSTYTPAALSTIYWYQGTELRDPAGALAYTESIRRRVDAPDVAQEVDKLLIGYYGDARQTAKMVEVADRLESEGALDFDGLFGVAEGAINAEEWQLARQYCGKARPLATADAVRAENTGRDLKPEQLAQMAADRQGKLLAKDGWARANLGEVDAALADFAEADRKVPRYYFDIPEYDLYVYWGYTLMLKGDHEGAIERFARNALVMQNEDALAGLKQAYAATHASDKSFEEWMHALHLEVAPRLDAFEMPGYDGDRHKFADLQGDVTLVSLWFPT